MTLRVLHVILTGHLGGIESHVRSLVLAQQGGGVQAEVVCCLREGDVSSDLVRSGVPMHCCGCESGHSVSLPLRLMRVISQVEPDILHFHSLPVLGALVARVSRTVSVYTLHLLPSNRMDRVAIAAYGKAIRGVISVGDDASLFDLCNKLFPTAQWRVIPNGVTIRISEAELPSTSTRAPIVLVVLGRAEADKHFADAIRALDLVRRWGMRARLRIIGGGSQLRLLRNEVRTLGLEDHIDFLGWQSDAAAFLKNATAMLLASEAETFGLVPLEAMASGVPVISYPMRGGINSWMKHNKNAVICEERSPKALAEAAKVLITDPDRYANLRLAGLQTAREHSAERMAAKTVEFYRDLVTGIGARDARA
ncbi:MAG TPA: glycosyltransferase [Phycisphaerae bacterium]|nr:glycosyltransferase [Phycisphaerae bacterium]